MKKNKDLTRSNDKIKGAKIYSDLHQITKINASKNTTKSTQVQTSPTGASQHTFLPSYMKFCSVLFSFCADTKTHPDRCH